MEKMKRQKRKRFNFANFELTTLALPGILYFFVFCYLPKQIWLKQGCNAFNATTPKSTPMSFWTNQDVLEYLRLTSIPYCELYGDIVRDEKGLLRFTGYERTGCAGCLFGCHLEDDPNRLQKLKITHPPLYKYLFEKLGYKEVCDFIGIPY